MNLRRRTLIAAVSFALLKPFAALAQQAGSYVEIKPPLPVDANGKIEVVELFWYGCIDIWINCGNYGVDVLYCIVHHRLVFLHMIPVNCRCISSLSYSMYMYASPVLPFVSVPPVF